MLTLHNYFPSLNGWKVRVLLGLLGTPYRTRPVAIFQGESRTDEFLKLNPAGAIPVLELEDGRAIAESNAILATCRRKTVPARRALARAKRCRGVLELTMWNRVGSLRFCLDGR